MVTIKDPLLHPYVIIIDESNYSVTREMTREDGTTYLFPQKTYHTEFGAALKAIAKKKVRDGLEDQVVGLEKYCQVVDDTNKAFVQNLSRLFEFTKLAD